LITAEGENVSSIHEARGFGWRTPGSNVEIQFSKKKKKKKKCDGCAETLTMGQAVK
jgi:ribosomal protein L34E